MQALERCPACRARMGDATECPRCGSDFSIARQAERQSLALARLAVRELMLGQTRQATVAAQAACSLASPLLARAVLRMIRQRPCPLQEINGPPAEGLLPSPPTPSFLNKSASQPLTTVH